eukprot:1159087-Pelagomonas_calceolata.AAC.1
MFQFLILSAPHPTALQPQQVCALVHVAQWWQWLGGGVPVVLNACFAGQTPSLQVALTNGRDREGCQAPLLAYLASWDGWGRLAAPAKCRHLVLDTSKTGCRTF